MTQKAALLTHITHHIRAFLPHPLNRHFTVLSCLKGRLMIGVKRSEFLTQLKFHHADLLSQLRQDPGFAHLVSIHYQVDPHLEALKILHERPCVPLQRQIFNPACLEAIQANLLSTTDPTLRAALEKLMIQLQGGSFQLKVSHD
jgi:hypothetical protein